MSRTYLGYPYADGCQANYRTLEVKPSSKSENSKSKSPSIFRISGIGVTISEWPNAIVMGRTAFCKPLFRYPRDHGRLGDQFRLCAQNSQGLPKLPIFQLNE